MGVKAIILFLPLAVLCALCGLYRPKILRRFRTNRNLMTKICSAHRTMSVWRKPEVKLRRK